MPLANVNGIEIEYVTEGDPTDPALLLVMGLGAQLTTWPKGFVDGLRQRGFFVILFDNRDSGLSTEIRGTAGHRGPLHGCRPLLDSVPH